jgi:hypothetical protein
MLTTGLKLNQNAQLRRDGPRQSQSQAGHSPSIGADGALCSRRWRWRQVLIYDHEWPSVCAYLENLEGKLVVKRLTAPFRVALL